MGAHLLLPFPCKRCGEPFTVRRYYYESGRRMYCGRACYTASRPRGFKKSNKSNYERKRESIARHPERHRCKDPF